MQEVVVVQHRPMSPKGLVIVTEQGDAIQLPVSPARWDFHEVHRWGTVEREGHKPVSRRKGFGLRTLSFTILVAALDYTVPVENRIIDLTSWAAKGSVVRIKNGSPTYQGGNWWYIKDQSVKVARVTKDGQPSQVVLDFSLEEYVDSASAVIKPPPPPPPPPPPIQTPTPQPAPVKEPIYRYHTVVWGDTIYKIAYKYLGHAHKWREVYTLNKAIIGSNPCRLKVGLKLKIPPR